MTTSTYGFLTWLLDRQKELHEVEVSCIVACPETVLTAILVQVLYRVHAHTNLSPIPARLPSSALPRAARARRLQGSSGRPRAPVAAAYKIFTDSGEAALYFSGIVLQSRVLEY